ncbi:cysteine hydrolase family protein [Streptomyces montanisoli]|uniref:Cysteine hydrolase n=1 Tax=Streptomyces montanisoli TaxID=2798581 RepID=A0A940M9I0_9ACTN|nr:isochorismatase family cysteine hydrolase [Streptomyces montanisoli]MBP0458775.1 cysteine hydrolase [Streptomyces montanisoli]
MTSAHTALVLIDLQQWIVDMPWQPAGGREVVDSCARLRDRFERAGSPVVLVRYLRADGADGGAQAPANLLVPGIAPRDGDLLVTKNGLDAFEGTDLDERLRARQVTGIVLAGLSTAHGVAATAAAAVASGYEVTVVTDATASVSEAEHDAALHGLAGLGARTCRAQDVLPEGVTGS